MPGLAGLILAGVMVATAGCRKGPDTGESSTPDGTATSVSALQVVVMDPLAAPLACSCVAGYAQRDYEKLGAFLEQRLGRPVAISFASDLPEALRRAETPIDVIVGKYSVVLHDASQAALNVRPIAMLTDPEGKTTQRGLFVVRADDPAKTLADLRDRKTILLGPVYAEEKHAAAIEALADDWVFVSGDDAPTAETCGNAALAVAEKKADAAVISSYCLPLLEGCGTIDKGSLRVIGRTKPVPFVAVFATSRMYGRARDRLIEALLAAGQNAEVRQALESRSGFVTLCDPAASIRLAWTDWRGPWRDGISDYVPKALPKMPRYRWKIPLTGQALSGLAATEELIIVADKDADGENDIWRGISTTTGEEIWTLSYTAAGEMDYGNSPRANPVIIGDKVYLLGAFGDLYCVQTRNGREIWKRNIVKDFGAELPTWGMCSTPLVVGDRLIVNPGGVKPEKRDAASGNQGFRSADVETYASIAALDRHTGKTIWATEGEPAAYASFIAGTFGGRPQVIGYDAVSLGSWDVQTGQRLWRLVPTEEGDFNVPTPIDAGGRLLVATENNGTRLYAFGDDGIIDPKPVAVNTDLAPDSHTPVVYRGRVFGASSGRLFCLDAETLQTIWTWEDEAFNDYVSIVAGNDRLMITTVTGEMILMDAVANKPTVVSRIALFGLKPMDVFSHPAVLRGRVLVRGADALMCMVTDPSEAAITDATQQIALFDGTSLGHWVETPFLGRTGVRIEDGAIVMERGHDMTGVTWTGPLFRQNYEITLQARRVAGEDFFCGLTFPVGREVCSLICGGWGGSLVGISCLDFYDAANNETATSHDFETGRWYDIRVRVTPWRIRAWIDGEQVVNCRITGRHLSVRFEVEPSRPLGIATWQTTGAVRNLTWKRIEPGPEDMNDVDSLEVP